MGQYEAYLSRNAPRASELRTSYMLYSKQNCLESPLSFEYISMIVSNAPRKHPLDMWLCGSHTTETYSSNAGRPVTPIHGQTWCIRNSHKSTTLDESQKGTRHSMDQVFLLGCSCYPKSQPWDSEKAVTPQAKARAVEFQLPSRQWVQQLDLGNLAVM